MNVVDAERWLLRNAERLIEEDSPEAIGYLERLLVSSGDRELRVYCLKNLGILHLAAGELDEAEKYLRSAAELSPRDPEIRHALGQVAGSAGHFWLALLEFLEALYHGRDRADVTAFMRSVAATMRQLQFGEAGLAVLIGARERNPQDPAILDTLAKFYESRERWLEAIEARDQLIEVLESRHQLPGPPTPKQLDEREARIAVERLTARMKNEMRLASDLGEVEVQVPSELSRIDLPSGLHTLVEALGLKTHNLPLLKTAQALWAQAADRQLDVHLSTSTLAAVIHWIVERLHWRVPTTIHDLARLYDADEERIPAAVRLLVACLEIEIFPTHGAKARLGGPDLDRLRRLQRALLYDVDLDEVEPRHMLGGGGTDD